MQADAEDHPTELLASKLRAGHADLPMRSGPWIDPADPTGELATTRDGTAVHLRPLRRDERELVAGFFAGQSAESRRRRFLQPMPRLPAAMLRRLVDVDGRRQVAVVAAVDGRYAGIARWIALADKPGAAEVAVTVTDRSQGRGIGRLLVEALRPLAVRAGLVQGRQRLPGRPLLDASSSSGPAAGQWPCRAGRSPRQLPDPHPHRFLDPSPAWEGLRWRESSRGDARHQEDVMHDATTVDSATRR